MLTLQLRKGGRHNHPRSVHHQLSKVHKQSFAVELHNHFDVTPAGQQTNHASSMSVAQFSMPTRNYACGKGTVTRHQLVKPFTSKLMRSGRHAATASSSRMPCEPAIPAHVSLLKQLFAGAVDLVSSSVAVLDRSKPCPVSYASAESHFRPMSAAARMAFAALEQDDDLDQQAALGALCLVTYSDDDDNVQTSQRTAVQASPAVQAFAALNTLQNSRKAIEVVDEDLEPAGGVMETLCIVSYDEEDQ